jgi:RNA polymerase sigma-70 factor (ECF subfamily)
MQLWAPVREKAYWAVLCIVNDRQLTEDVLQEALIIAIEKFQTLRDESKFEPWFIKIAVRKAYEMMAKRNSVPVQSIDAELGYEFEAAAPDNAFTVTQYKDIVSRIMDSLKPESKRYLFYLKYIEDRPMEDIIRFTGMKEGTLKSVYFRMRKELGLMLGKEYGENG